SYVAFCVAELVFECQVWGERERFVAATSGQVSRHVESRVPGILDVEDAGPASKRPLVGGTPGQSQTRGEIQFVIVDQAIAQSAVARDLDGGIESERRVFVHIAGAGTDRGWLVVRLLHVCCRIDE